MSSTLLHPVLKILSLRDAETQRKNGLFSVSPRLCEKISLVNRYKHESRLTGPL
ncbi:hypothetical protein Pr1d_12260 [Bythopirellula goksoeyrii]|uniref:Uncharacterized protein n=1 Tax=Bythopirellula goksoeyrii TaxID=1400387 RepID=A0A5B9Q8T7_9BACT|nr:hypothetical protein Pr1d_12260 [Bythopirellula goksoeyrii]